MKKMKVNRRWLYLLAICIIVQLYSCQSKIDFKLNNKVAALSPDPIMAVKSYKLRYNPKANGSFTITLINGSEYKAENINASQLSSFLVLLNSPGLQFDTKNEEFTLEGEK
jgi:hypothetical protein